jgi:hypothetical protein
MAQVVSRGPVTAETQVRVWVSPCGFMVDKVALGWDSHPFTWFSPANIILPWISVLISSGG